MIPELDDYDAEDAVEPESEPYALSLECPACTKPHNIDEIFDSEIEACANCGVVLVAVADESDNTMRMQVNEPETDDSPLCGPAAQDESEDSIPW